MPSNRSSKNYRIGIYCQPLQLSFFPIPNRPRGVFTWKQNPVSWKTPLKNPRGTCTYSLSSRNTEEYEQIVNFRNHRRGLCLFEDVIEATNSHQARSQGIRRFWEDFFSRYYTVASKDRFQFLILWQIIRFGDFGLPRGLYVKVEEITEFSIPLWS